MKKVLFLSIVVFVSTRINAQVPLNWSSPMIVNSTIGSDWPRVAISNSTPVIVWGDFLSGVLLYRRLVNGAFEAEEQLTPGYMSASVFSLTGPDMKAAGDTVYVTYVDAIGGHAYLQRSFDEGLTFSDTIRIDHVGDHSAAYSAIDIMPGGEPIISYAQLSAGSSNPQYVVTKSVNEGSTFSPEVSVTAALGADPCDCCPGTIVYHDGVVAVLYRNAINNIRDMRAAISYDGGNTFSAIANIDNHNWFFENCPSTGGEGIIQGDSLISVFMNGSGGSMCYVSTMNLSNLQLGFEKPLFNLPGGGSQNHARIVARGDTIAAVWEQSIGINKYIMFSYSLTGPSGLGVTVDTISNALIDGHHTNPDIAYSNGKFYVVFADEGMQQIYLMEGVLYQTIGIANVSSAANPSIHVAGNLQGDAFTITSNQIRNEPCLVSIRNANGSLCEQHELAGLENTQLVHLDHQQSSGIYLVSISSKDFSVSEKWVIVY